jgi:hypothetical protein
MNKACRRFTHLATTAKLPTYQQVMSRKNFFTTDGQDDHRKRMPFKFNREP